MNMIIKQVSSLKKIRSEQDMKTNEIYKKTMLGGECFSYQIALWSDRKFDFKFEINSPLKDFISIYSVKKTAMDYPTYFYCNDDDYITKEPGFMPDLLVPLADQKDWLVVAEGAECIWLEIKLPHGFAAGNYDVEVKICGCGGDGDCEKVEISKLLTVEVIAAEVPKQKTIFTQWFHTDCIASAHNTEIYSEEHWALIDKYMALASELGINMLLTPVITPPLDTEIGTMRPNVQLAAIEKNGDKYSFDFSKLKRWISLCKKNNIEYYEISHFFSQWGLKCAPNITVKKDGEEKLLFGWHIAANDPSYKAFLEQFIPSLMEFLKEEGIVDKCKFHISDEPSFEHLENYRYAYEIVKPLIGDCEIMDALSNINFYDQGLLSVPVTSTNEIEPFLERKIENQWAYYCCGQINKVGNRFLAMPSYRNRILGLQMYKYGIKGFLQWGYNFYYGRISRYEINPYVSTSGDKAFPSGDAFSVYPGKNRPLPSLRAIVFKEALQDIELCRLLESYIGKDAVVEIIDSFAETPITFSEYPRNDEYISKVMAVIENKIKEFCK